MDNVGDEEKEIALLLFIDVHSESGKLGDYDYAKTHCDGKVPPKGSFNCKLALIFPAAPKQISIKVGEGMAGDTVTFNITSPERALAALRHSEPGRLPTHQSRGVRNTWPILCGRQQRVQLRRPPSQACPVAMHRATQAPNPALPMQHAAHLIGSPSVSCCASR
jgi:hypothetical protein